MHDTQSSRNLTCSAARRLLGPVLYDILVTVAVGILLAATLLACTGGGEDTARDERVLELEAKAHSLEESLEALADENAELKGEIAILREHLDDRDARLEELEEVVSKAEWVLPGKEQWSQSKAERLSLPEGNALERTVRLAEDSGGEVHYVDHPGREDRTVLVMPQEFVDGEAPLIGSLHGYGGNSADHTTYFPLHERVNADGFALLLPNGTLDGEGNPFWNPTDRCCDGGKTGEDDVAYLSELVASAKKIKDFGPVYFFGYSNGGFMSHHIAYKGLPGLRAVASLAGTSYVVDSSCDGAPPVSVLHIHGTADGVILYEGDETGRDTKGDGERAFYAGAQDMVTRWSRRAGCDRPEEPRPYATLDLDQNVPGSETQAFRLESGLRRGNKYRALDGHGQQPFARLRRSLHGRSGGLASVARVIAPWRSLTRGSIGELEAGVDIRASAEARIGYRRRRAAHAHFHKWHPKKAH